MQRLIIPKKFLYFKIDLTNSDGQNVISALVMNSSFSYLHVENLRFLISVMGNQVVQSDSGIYLIHLAARYRKKIKNVFLISNHSFS